MTPTPVANSYRLLGLAILAQARSDWEATNAVEDAKAKAASRYELNRFLMSDWYSILCSDLDLDEGEVFNAITAV